MNTFNDSSPGDYREETSFWGRGIIEFSQFSKTALRQIAELLIPHKEEILERWVKVQFSSWKPPAFSREELEHVFGELFYSMLDRMRKGELEGCIADLEKSGADLARRNFPYEALIISVHFLEESYSRYLLETPNKEMFEWLIKMDEFLHAALAAVATSYFQAHRRELLEEAEAGRIVQEALLPDIPETVSDLDAAYVYLLPGKWAKVGGDLIDLFMLDDREATFIVGDFSGHGLEAATDAAMLRSLFRGFMRENPDIVHTMARLNYVLGAELAVGEFVTAVAGVYSGSGHLKLVSAGHPPPVICGDDCRLLEPRGTALGIERESTYSLSTLELDAGDLLVAYTDGLVEASNGEALFGETRVLEAVERMRKAPVRVIVEHLRDEVLHYSHGKLMDDVAILGLKCRA